MTVLSRLTALKSTPRLAFPWSPGVRGIRQPGRSQREGGMNLAPKNAQEIPIETRGLGTRLIRSTVFAGGFCGGVFICASVSQYERYRRQAQGWGGFRNWIDGHRGNSTHKEGELRKQINNWWNSRTQGQRVFWAICMLNILVFSAWRIPTLQPFLLTYFVSNPAARVHCSPMVLSTFSHLAFFHLASNMYVLHSFSSPVCKTLGLEQFIGLYLSGGVLSSLASHFFKGISRCPGPSLGASGAIMCLLGYFCTSYPSAELQIIFLPGFGFSADTALKSVMLLDTVGMVLRWRVFDHAAHLGGALVGVFYAHFGSILWAKSEKVMRIWHDIRNQISNKKDD